MRIIAVVDFRRAQDQPMQGDLLLAAAVGPGNRSRPLPFLFGRPLAVLQMMRALGGDERYKAPGEHRPCVLAAVAHAAISIGQALHDAAPGRNSPRTVGRAVHRKSPPLTPTFALCPRLRGWGDGSGPSGEPCICLGKLALQERIELSPPPFTREGSQVRSASPTNTPV
jgi:hypothetical protein